MVRADTLTLRGGAQINSNTTGAGPAGNITVHATNVTITGRGRDGFPSALAATSKNSGDAGLVTLVASIVRLADGGGVTTLSEGTGRAGDIVVQVDTLTLAGGSQMTSSTRGTGRGGALTVTARQSVTMAGEDTTGIASALTSNTRGGGAAGQVTLTAPIVRLVDRGSLAAQSTGTGPAGNIVVTAGTLTLTGGAQITSSSFDTGPSGTVTVTATDTVLITGQDRHGNPSLLASAVHGSGDAGRVTLSAPSVRLVDGGSITTASAGSGRAGDILVEASTVTLTHGAQMTSSSFGTGPGGSVQVAAIDTITLAGPDSVLLTTAEGSGPGGTLTLTARVIQLTDGGIVSAESLGAGNAGSVVLRATDSITIAGQGSGLAASTAGQGRGGNITLQARLIQLADGAGITAESIGAGNAGDITIDARDSFLSTRSNISTRAAQADGGNIQLTALTFVRLRDSTITAEVGGGAATVGGNILIDPQFVLLQNSRIVANAFAGRGGNIRIQAQQAFLADPDSLVSASSTLGIDGLVDIRAPVTSLSGTVAPLPYTFARGVEVLRERCAARLWEGQVSTLVERGRYGIPARPGGVLPSLLDEEPVEEARSGEPPVGLEQRSTTVHTGTFPRADNLRLFSNTGLARPCLQ